MKAVFRAFAFLGVAFVLCACGKEGLEPNISEFSASQDEVEVGGILEFTVVGSTGSGESEELDYSGTITIVGDGIEVVGDEFEPGEGGELIASFEGPSVTKTFELRLTEAGAISISAILKTSRNAQNGRSVTIMVVDSPVESVSLNETSLSIEETEEFRLVATVEPSDAIQLVDWSSSDPRVARVTPSGSVTGVRAGTVTITVTTRQGGKTATCDVTVKPASPGRTMDNALSLGTLEAGNTAPFEAVQIPGATDWYFVFSVPEVDEVAVSMNAISGIDSTRGDLYGAERRAITMPFELPVYPQYVITTLPGDTTAGTYYLGVRLGGDSDKLYNFELRAWTE